ncbi:Hypothetical protein HVR_LOCUS1177 [uncultured virus]|nr:Hypothetical protein HVR_LOCUS1177 [uncultured virus]
MLLRLFSDIHLELSNNGLKLANKILSAPVPDKTILILAGDIGNPNSKLYRNFITGVSQKYHQVLVITGNHEYYQKYQRKISDHGIVHKYKPSIEEIDDMVRNIANSLPNVHFLQRSAFIYNRVRFLGCTLWTQSKPDLSKYMNDYQYISNMTPSLCESLHKADVEWLTSQLNSTEKTDYDRRSCHEENLTEVPTQAELRSVRANAQACNPTELDSSRDFTKSQGYDRRSCHGSSLAGSQGYDYTVVITHHLPSYKLIDGKYADNPLNSFFANHLDELVAKADIWCCGHSHSSAQAIVGTCRCYLNPVGYSGESTGFNQNILIPVSGNSFTIENSK